MFFLAVLDQHIPRHLIKPVRVVQVSQSPSAASPVAGGINVQDALLRIGGLWFRLWIISLSAR